LAQAPREGAKRPHGAMIALLRLALFAILGAGALLRSTKTAPPMDLDASTFISQLEKEGGDHLILLYSPTCPDCQWFMSRWAGLAEDLRSTPLTMWTVADPGFLAPEPYVHWHNPAILLAPAGNVANPVAFPDATLEQFMKGDSRPQSVQDSVFRQGILDFVSQQAVQPLALMSNNDAEGQKQLKSLAKASWRLLQKRWGIAKNGEPATAATQTSSQPTKQISAASLVSTGTDALVKKYTEKYEQQHPDMAVSQVDYIEKYYRTYFLAHPGA